MAKKVMKLKIIKEKQKEPIPTTVVVSGIKQKPQKPLSVYVVQEYPEEDKKDIRKLEEENKKLRAIIKNLKIR